jgi:hypothetical protein
MKHPIIVFAIAKDGKGNIKKVGTYKDVEKISIKIKDYPKDTVIEMEQYFVGEN